MSTCKLLIARYVCKFLRSFDRYQTVGCRNEADDDLRLHVRLTSLMISIVLKLHCYDHHPCIMYDGLFLYCTASLKPGFVPLRCKSLRGNLYVLLQVAWETRIQALQGMLEECVQDDKAVALQTAVLRFIADHLAALVESSEGAMESNIRQALVQLMQTATDRLQVTTTFTSRLALEISSCCILADVHMLHVIAEHYLIGDVDCPSDQQGGGRRRDDRTVGCAGACHASGRLLEGPGQPHTE